MSRNGGLILSALAMLTTGCATLQHAPASVKSDLLVRVWVPLCSADAACVSTERRRYQGALIHMDPTGLTLFGWQESDPAVTLALASVTEIRLYRGRKPSVAAAVKHGLVGAGVGAALGRSRWNGCHHLRRRRRQYREGRCRRCHDRGRGGGSRGHLRGRRALGAGVPAVPEHTLLPDERKGGLRARSGSGDRLYRVTSYGFKYCRRLQTDHGPGPITRVLRNTPHDHRCCWQRDPRRMRCGEL